MSIIKTITHSYEGGQTVIKTEMTPLSLFVLSEEKGNHNEAGETRSTVPLGEMGTHNTQGNYDYETKAVVVSKDYFSKVDDHYIGVSADRPITITLPPDCRNCHKIVIKAEMDPPLGNRKITVKAANDKLIDGCSEYIIQTSWDSVVLIHRDENWYIIK